MNDRSDVLHDLTQLAGESPGSAAYILGYLGAFLTTEQLQAARSSYLEHVAVSHTLLSRIPE